MLKSGFRKYLAKKIAWYSLALIIAIALNFFLPRLIPGNPVQSMLHQMTQGGGVASDAMERLYTTYMEEFGLNKPIYRQFIDYFVNVFTGDLGTSFMLYPGKVANLIGEALPWTLAIQIPAILIGWLIGNVLGAMASYKGGRFDSTVFTTALVFSNIPYYCLAILLVYLFGVQLNLFPIAGGHSLGMFPGLYFDFVVDAIYHWMLPFLSMILVAIGGQAIGMREMSIYELTSDYVNYSKALGLRDKKVVRYVFRNAMLPQITGLALSFGTMVGGALVTESVFSYPGMGSLLFSAIRQNDYPVIQGVTLIITVTVLMANFLVDVAYGFIDPRVRAAQLGER